MGPPDPPAPSDRSDSRMCRGYPFGVRPVVEFSFRARIRPKKDLKNFLDTAGGVVYTDGNRSSMNAISTMVKLKWAGANTSTAANMLTGP